MTGQTLYEILGVVPSAGADQIEKAYRRALDLYAEGSLATYTLLDSGEQESLRQRVQDAYDVLRDPAKRVRYDEELRTGLPAPPVVPPSSPWTPRAPSSTGPAPLSAVPTSPPIPRTTPAPRSVYAPAPTAPTLPEPVTGSALRAAREACGVSLQQIATASKVGVRTLESIETERLDILPAPVYLRGFVQEYARALGLDPRATAEAYLTRIRSLQA
jgi:curved DNA-binding protein CbpA